MALRWRFFFASGFLAFRGKLGKRRNIPSGERHVPTPAPVRYKCAIPRRDAPELCVNLSP
jgi:hypothetical protein